MTENLMIDGRANEYKEKTTHLMYEMREFIKDIDDIQIKNKVSQFLKSVSDPYMFVVMGEVKAGKSSFINALVGDDLCKVSSAPCTDMVHEIRYGEENLELLIGDKHKREFFNNERLRNFAIVDTPGTDSIVSGHEAITKNFIPSSDLLIVVLPAINPHNDSVWNLVKKIKNDWNKKILFVIQQKDLVDDETLRKTTNAVKAYAMELGFSEPIIFSISAEEEMNGFNELSGYKLFRDYIKETITDTNSMEMKERSNIEDASSIVENIKGSFEMRYMQYEEDIIIVNNINKTVDDFRETHNRDLDKLLEGLMIDVDEEVENYRLEIVRRLEPQTIKERFSNKGDFQLWLSTINDNYKNILSRNIEQKTQQAMKNYIYEMESILERSCKYLEEREEYLEFENNIYGRLAESKKNIVEETRTTIIKISAHNKSLYEASGELFLEIWEARSKFEMKKSITAVGTSIIGTAKGAQLAKNAAEVAKVAAKSVVLMQIGTMVGGILVTAGLIVVLNKFLAENVYSPNMIKEVDKAVDSFNIKVEEAKEIMKIQLSEFITGIFENELKNMERNFLEFRTTTYIDDDKLPRLKKDLELLQANIKELLSNYKSGDISG